MPDQSFAEFSPKSNPPEKKNSNKKNRVHNSSKMQMRGIGIPGTNRIINPILTTGVGLALLAGGAKMTLNPGFGSSEKDSSGVIISSAGMPSKDLPLVFSNEKLNQEQTVRNQIIQELLPKLSASEIKILNTEIDQEMKGRKRDMDEVITKYAALISQAAKDTGVPDYLIAGMLGAESGYDSESEAPDSDATGIAGFEPIAAEEMGIMNQAKKIDLGKNPNYAIPALAGYVEKYNKLGPAFGTMAFKTGPGDLLDYSKVFLAENNVTPPNAYSVIENAKHLLKDPADVLYLPRVIGEAAQWKIAISNRFSSKTPGAR